MDNMIAIVVVILAAILGIAVCIGLFFLFRAITCWYFKINKIVAELKKIDEHLGTIARLTEQSLVVQRKTATDVPHAVPATPVVPVSAPVVEVEPEVVSTPAARFCTGCGAQLQDGQNFCTQCGAKN